MGDRLKVVLACVECAARNYRTTRVRETKPSLEMKKYCPTCKRHTVHRETK
ncbi:MAG TPA: 50S ribosomal protein L33 [Polyangiaceae bacterium]|nr:50S ribosomal protein L33 [Polyangiaceae bacterium]HNZ21552.1 50S ribosomal protein L33 [Polyangiaceae bacterium]HOD21692.1 50S ribosomal protein L33 [Polyangiaceae bacterium]HOE48149.1 50S ribosomal protein L33 [Polyangiaceae bacterium]HOH00873.1 50S ribosomal protein L33 [Polyangiaceae bacterium]